MFLWWHATRQLNWQIALAFLAVLLAGIAARISWIHLPGGQLEWDGDVWRWESANYQAGAAEHELTVIADFQRNLLLRLENQARASLWLWVEQGAMPERWLELRRAVYSPHKQPSGLSPHDFFIAEPSSLPSPTLAVSTAKNSANVSQAKL